MKEIPTKILLYLILVAIVVGTGIAYFSNSAKHAKTQKAEILRPQTQNVIEKANSSKPNSLIPSSTDVTSEQSEEETFCAQVITPAKNPTTGKIEEFPTPCDVPDGWEIISSHAVF